MRAWRTWTLLALGVAVGLVLVPPVCRVESRAGGVDLHEQVVVGDGARAPRAAPLTPVEVAPEQGRSRPSAGSPPASEASIHGRVLLPGGVSCVSGWVFAWPDGVVPTPQLFRGFSDGGDPHPVGATRIASDGTFRFAGILADEGYTLSAVSRGAVCVERPVGIRPGPEPVELELWFTYGLAVRLEERGWQLRTTPLLFGKGPIARGSAQWLRENPPELQALRIEGLEPGPGTRDRRQFLIAQDSEQDRAVPFEFEVEVPGYSRRVESLAALRLVDRLEEVVLELEARTTSWGEIGLRVRVPSEILEVGLDPETIIGVVYLTEDDKDPIQFAVHARALHELQEIEGIPAGTYQALFQAAEAYVELDLGRIAIGAGRNVLEVDCTGTGGLLFEFVEDGTRHEGRFIGKVLEPDGPHFYVSSYHGPHLVPTVLPGRYRLSELQVAGQSCSCLTGGEIEIVEGRLSVALLSCSPATQASR